MNHISIIILVLLFLFFFEKRTIIALLYFIGLTVLVAILISLDPFIRLINGEYLSYILILVQVGAISVLFGLVIMLLPDSSFRDSKLLSSFSFFSAISPRFQISKKYIFFFFLLFSSLLFFSSSSLFPYPFFSSPPFFFSTVSFFSPSLLFSDTLLFKIGFSLYTVPSFIIKFFLLTIILLLAIVGLFFLIS
jgi:NADH:ubiquinone oxidoreductase subunit 6 (subunit J)